MCFDGRAHDDRGPADEQHGADEDERTKSALFPVDVVGGKADVDFFGCRGKGRGCWYRLVAAVSSPLPIRQVEPGQDAAPNSAPQYQSVKFKHAISCINVTTPAKDTRSQAWVLGYSRVGALRAFARHTKPRAVRPRAWSMPARSGLQGVSQLKPGHVAEALPFPYALTRPPRFSWAWALYSLLTRLACGPRSS